MMMPNSREVTMSGRSRAVLVSFVAAVLAFSGILHVPVVQAATFNVDTILDLPHSQPVNGNCTPCSLRSAIEAANFLTSNGDLGPHTINLPAGTYLLTVTSNGAGVPLSV